MSDKKKQCLLTGYPGFVGSHLYDFLSDEYTVHTLGLVPAQSPNHQVVDLSCAVPHLSSDGYDLVVHAAGKAHFVPRTRAEADLLLRVNHQGTVNLLKALTRSKNALAAFVLISSVAVYGRDRGARIAETEPLAADDPYGVSKIRAEAALMEWSHGDVCKGILRLPLVVGRAAPGNLGRMISAIRTGTYSNIARGQARRSCVWIDDVGPFIIRLARKGGIYNLTDGSDLSFAEMSGAIAKHLGRKRIRSLPLWLVLPPAWIGDGMERLMRKRMPFNTHTLRKMTSNLTFSSEKAIHDFGWQPTKVLDRIGESVE